MNIHDVFGSLFISLGLAACLFFITKCCSDENAQATELEKIKAQEQTKVQIAQIEHEQHTPPTEYILTPKKSDAK